MANILFRADSSSFIGTGHIMRDLVLAKKYPKDNIYFAVRNLKGNINFKILKVIKKFKNLNLNVVTTKANKNLKSLQIFCKKNSFISLYINSNKIATLINNFDFVIVTPSVTVNEVYFLKKTIIAIKTAENQIYIFNFLKKNIELVIPKFNKEKLNIALCKINKRFLNE